MFLTASIFSAPVCVSHDADSDWENRTSKAETSRRWLKIFCAPGMRTVLQDTNYGGEWKSLVRGLVKPDWKPQGDWGRS